MTVKLLTEHHLEFLSFKGVGPCSYESTLVEIPHCLKYHVTAHCNTPSGSGTTQSTHDIAIEEDLDPDRS